MDGLDLTPTLEGTPQGGVLSPLLANIALHGLETAITTAFPPSIHENGTQVKNWQPRVIRYADDFVVLHPRLAIIEQARGIAATWLKGMGLELKPSKTRITHTLQPHDGAVGFDFLGFEVRQHHVGRRRSATVRGGKALGFKTIIRPRKTAQRRHQEALRAAIKGHKAASQAALIARLNPIVRGWCNYHARTVAKKVFATMQHLLYQKLYRWAKRRHPHKGRGWVTERYWHHKSEGRWDFHVTGGAHLHLHAKTPIRRHVKVKGSKSVFDGDWIYWSARLGAHPQMPRQAAALLKRQQGKCAWCGLIFSGEERREIDHVVPVVRGGSHDLSNRQLLHGHCHDAKSARDGTFAGGARDKG